MSKKCKRCENIKPFGAFSLSQSNRDGYATTCKPCVCQRNKEYWRTPTGRMSQIYAVQVVNSKQRKHHVPEYTRDELTNWAYQNGLHLLVYAWVASGYEKDLTPSVDRKDPYLGYSLSNIRLVTWKENNEKAYEDRKACLHVTKQNRKVRQITLQGVPVSHFDSIASAARETGITRVNINDVCRGKIHCKTAGGFLWEYA